MEKSWVFTIQGVFPCFELYQPHHSRCLSMFWIVSTSPASAKWRKAALLQFRLSFHALKSKLYEEDWKSISPFRLLIVFAATVIKLTIAGFYSAPHTGHGADIGRLFCILQKQPSTVQICCIDIIFKLKLKSQASLNFIFAELLFFVVCCCCCCLDKSEREIYLCENIGEFWLALFASLPIPWMRERGNVAGKRKS